MNRRILLEVMDASVSTMSHSEKGLRLTSFVDACLFFDVALR